MSAVLSKSHEVPRLQHLFSFARQLCGTPPSRSWEDEEGVRHSISQHEGGEQGASSCRFHSAWQNNIQVLVPHRARSIHDLPGDRVFQRAGIHLHEGITRVWNNAGVCPEGTQEFGLEVWKHEGNQDSVWNDEGVKILGTPVGSSEYVSRLVSQRLEEEKKLRETIRWVPDLQCAWQSLLPCAGPRCDHLLRTLHSLPSLQLAGVREKGLREGSTARLHSKDDDSNNGMSVRLRQQLCVSSRETEAAGGT